MNRTTRRNCRTILATAAAAAVALAAVSRQPASAADAILDTDVAGDAHPMSIPQTSHTSALEAGALDLLSLRVTQDDSRTTLILDVEDLADAPLGAYKSGYSGWVETPGRGWVNWRVTDNLSGDPDTAELYVSGPGTCCMNAVDVIPMVKREVENRVSAIAADPVAEAQEVLLGDYPSACSVQFDIDVAADEVRISCPTDELSAALVAAGAAPVTDVTLWRANYAQADVTYGTPGASTPVARVPSGLYGFHDEMYDQMYPHD